MLSLYREDPSEDGPSEISARATLRALRESPAWGNAVVMEEAGATTGYALLISFYSNELRGRVCIIDEIYVVPQCRGRGFASAFLETLARKTLFVFTDAVALELEVSPKNEAARALYLKAGFVPIRNTTLRRAVSS